jgi:hypothetical protein
MRLWTTALAVLVLGTAAQVASAGDGCCQGCGCQCQCRRVTCRIVCEMKKEKYHFYVCEGECFGLPGPGRKESLGCGCGQCGSECAPGECGCTPCGCMPKDCHRHQPTCIWKPSWCHLYNRKILKKYECEKEIPCYKCIVVDLCPSCCAQMSSCGAVVEEGEAPPPLPPAPKAAPTKPMPPSARSQQRRGLLDILGTNATK